MENKITNLIIEEEDKNEAQFMSRNFVASETRNRVYLNALGAEAVTRYLGSEGIDTSDLHNLHSISKIIEATDISDIQLPNIHIDVRVVFDENQIFIPQSHFDLGITPDIYVVLKIDENIDSMELLGYFTPKQINKKHKNAQYYFVSRDKLSSGDTLASFVRNFAGNTSEGISEDEMLKGRALSISLSDHDISNVEKYELFKLLLASDELRESVLEFDNFETLSYNVVQNVSEDMVFDNDIEETEISENEPQEESFETETQDTNEEDSEPEESIEAEEQIDNIKDAVEEEISDDADEEVNYGNNNEEIPDNINTDISLEEEPILEISDETSLPELDITSDSLDENLSGDNTNHDSSDDKENIVLKSVETATEIAGAIGLGAAGAAAAGIAGETIAAGAATQGAIDLAGIAGEIGKDILDSEQNEEHLKFEDIQIKQDNVDENEEQAKKSQDEFNTPKDLSEFEQIENYTTVEEIEQETVNLSDMEQIVPDNDIDIHLENENLTDFSNMEQSEELFTQQLENGIVEDLENIETDPFGVIEVPKEDENVLEVNNITNNSTEEDFNTGESDNEESEYTYSSEEITDEEINIYEENSFEEEETTEFEEETEKYTEEFDFENETETDADQNQNDWISDTNYDNLDDVTSESVLQQEENIDFEGLVSDSQEYVETEETPVSAIENSAIISDTNFAVGEIEIDINKPENLQLEGSEHLEHLYNEEDTLPGASLLGSSGIFNKSVKKMGLIGILISIVIIGILGFSISKLMKGPKEETPQPITDTSSSDESSAQNSNVLSVDEKNVVNMDNNSAIVPSNIERANTESKVQTPQTAQKLSPTQFIGVSKLSWEVPDYVSTNQSFRQYFQSAGKSLKLSLTSDLLLASDYVYSDQIRVSINFAQDGTLKDAKILLSSGSQQVDKIVLQTVNQTLNILKAPHSVGNDSGTTVILKIYF